MTLSKLIRSSFTKYKLIYRDFDYRYDFYITPTPIVKTYLDGEVPIGILLDYIEENPNLIVTYYDNPIDKEDALMVIHKLRAVYTNPTELHTNPIELYSEE